MRKEEKDTRTPIRTATNRAHDPPKTQAAGKGSPDSGARRSAAKGSSPPCREVEHIRTWLKQVRFKKTAFGGVDEADVWKKIGELNTLYEQALAAERMRYDALLEERLKAVAKRLAAQMRTGWPKKAGDAPYE